MGLQRRLACSNIINNSFKSHTINGTLDSNQFLCIKSLKMNSYSYNQERSISRLDELLNRNQIIYQNLKLKLDQINKSSQNIHRNISHIHQHSQESNSIITSSQASSFFPPNTANQGVSLNQSSAVQQQIYFRHPLSIHDQNLSSINESREGVLCDSMLESSRRKQFSKSQFEIVDGDSRKVMYQLIQPEQRRPDQLTNSLQKSRQSHQLTFEQDRTAYLEIQNLNVPLHQPYQSSSTPQLTNKNLKGNSIYLNNVPRTQVQISEPSFQQMPTFRQLEEKNSWRKQEVQATNQKIEKQKLSSPSHEELSFKFDLSAEKVKKQSPNHCYLNEQFVPNFAKTSPLASSSLCYTPADILQTSNRFQQSNNLTDSELTINLIANTPSPHAKAALYRKLSGTINNKISSTEGSCQNYLFAPFNKVYRSPILQIKSGGVVLLQRRSKTTLPQSTRISDPIKYRFKNVVTDQQLILKLLFGGRETLNLCQIQNCRVAIIGGKDTLKKKLHLGLLAFLLQTAANQVIHSSQSSFIKVQHHATGKQGKDDAIQTNIQGKKGSERVALLQLERSGEDISRSILNGPKNEKFLRVSQVSVQGESSWNFSIISSNRIDSEFVKHLGAGRICWTINPLIKNYEQVQLTLNSMSKFIHPHKQ